MKHEEHCKKSKELFGHEYKRVHKFLDQYAKYLGTDHRKVLHNWLGIEICSIKFGVHARKAARQHILDDNMNPDKEDTEV